MDFATEHLIRENAELVINTCKQQMNVTLAYNEKSVAWVDDYIERNRKTLSENQVEALINVIGSFLGECIQRNYGGIWSQRDEGLAICFDSKNCVFPFNKVEKQFINGSEDSISSFYTLIPIVFKTVP
jgi:hypothetical protein